MQSNLRVPLSDEPHVVATTVVSATALEKKLGYAAFHVWSILLTRRNEQGLTHTTVLGIGKAKGFARTCPRTVEKALVRLRSAGLVEDLGWQKLRVPRGTSFIVVAVYVRRVLGARLFGGRNHEVAVPPKTVQWMSVVCGWGGPRKGSGRKGASMAEKPNGFSDRGIQVGTTPSTTGGTPHLIRKKNQVGGTPEESSGGTDIYLQVKKGTFERGGLSPSGKDSAPVGAQVSTLSGGEELGEGLAGPRTRPAPMLATPRTGVPRYPGIDVVAPAQVPDPPLLDPESPSLDHVTILAAAYRGAVESRFGGRCYVLRGDLRGTKHWAAFVGAAEALIEHNIPPAAWAAFSCDVWKKFSARGPRPTRGKGWPPVAWVFSAKRIEERRGWFRAEESDYSGGRAIFGPKHKDLMYRFARLDWVLGDPRVRDVGAVVEQFFPGNLYEELVNAARAEAADYRERFKRQIREGRFLW